jgi:hypothetical protein
MSFSRPAVAIGTSSFAFRWQDGALRLIGYDRDAIIKNTGTTEKVSIDYPARRMVTTTGTMAGDIADSTDTGDPVQDTVADLSTRSATG